MDDLSGLSWTSGPNDPPKPPPLSSGSLFSSMRAPSGSGKSTPVSGNLTASNPSSKSTTPANDSFASLVSFGSSNNNKNLSLLEQQKRLEEQRAKQEAERRAQLEAHYGGQNAQFLDSLGQSGSTRALSSAVSQVQTSAAIPDDDEDDLLAAFNASAPVDASTHFPVPTSSSSPRFNPASNQTSHRAESTSQSVGMDFPEDDDPFGLGQMSSKSTTAPNPPAVQGDDDDFLGLLGKPVSEVAQARTQATTDTRDHESRSPPSHPDDARDRAIAELVDMGFPADKAGQALDNTGVDVQAAVGWLLNQAHAESRQKARAKADAARLNEPGGIMGDLERRREQSERRERNIPSWMKGEDAARRRDDSRSPVSRERDVSEIAANLGNQFLKTANSLWKTGSRKVQQAVQEFSGESDPSQPRWMREAAFARENQRTESQSRQSNRDNSINPGQNTSNTLTEEALLLESEAPRPARHGTRPKGDVPTVPESRGSRHPTPVPAAPSEKYEAKPASIRQQQQPHQSQQQFTAMDPKSRLTRAAVEEQSSQAYVSPARRRRPAQQQSATEPTIDLLESSKPSPSGLSSSSTPSRQASQSSEPPKPLPSRPKVPARTVPHVSPSSLMSSHQEREKGNEAYKRGDYAAAHEAFARALSFLPNSHPLTIVLLSNRAMTALKIGEPKAAIADADSILAVIGPSKGEGEEIEFGNGQPAKPMRDFFGKALMRKAEALEQLERWEDAAKIWKQAVETGHGGSTSIQGRNRCEKAAGISKPTPVASNSTAPRPTQPKRPAAAPRKSALEDLAGRPVSTAEAVTRLRAANEAADRVDEERLALTDSVDAKVAAWKGGKQDNLRALLASLDSILWPEAGWKKINMSELVLPNKVKVHYMKGIAKVHPDKIPTNATTEQRMIAGAVFSALNEAWDKFRKENNL
ncbi:hypothetical protein VTN77DRAFT_2727 [Rasamsonia byssochlamydoides]|uniref:uncharacterized protein n=1 Tax=Rasamsonia byssochlamydoides TaxID=89139 RepID=UPI003742899E